MGWSDEQHPQQSHRNRKSRYNLQLTEVWRQRDLFSLPLFFVSKIVTFLKILYFSNLDAYVNIVGGMRLDEPAADLAVALSLVSGLKDIPIDENLIAFGEIGLSGELRSVPRAQARINEAARLGFTKCILPKACIKQIATCPDSLELIGVTSLKQAIDIIK